MTRKRRRLEYLLSGGPTEVVVPGLCALRSARSSRCSMASALSEKMAFDVLCLINFVDGC